PNKGKCWIKRKYFKKYNNDNWRFMTSNKIHFIIHSDHVIKRHIKVQKTRSPYDGDWVYWGKRLRKIPDKPLRVIKLLKLQQSKCDNCRLWFKSDDTIEIHHKDRNRRNNMIKNLSLLHGHCHDELHRRCA
ncbi:HNH endonuclease signature motif containing protein, partial [Wolbachia endosymbiont of Drosophila malagassya]